MATQTDYYDILGVSKGASAMKLKSIPKQALEWHPTGIKGTRKRQKRDSKK